MRSARHNLNAGGTRSQREIHDVGKQLSLQLGDGYGIAGIDVGVGRRGQKGRWLLMGQRVAQSTVLLLPTLRGFLGANFHGRQRGDSDAMRGPQHAARLDDETTVQNQRQRGRALQRASEWSASCRLVVTCG